MIFIFSSPNFLASSNLFINISATHYPSKRSVGLAVYLLFCSCLVFLCPHTFWLCWILQSLSVFFLTSSSFLSPIPPLCDKIDYCWACASIRWISTRPLRQKLRASVSPFCSPRILSSPAAVPTILHPQVHQSFADPFVTLRKQWCGRWVITRWKPLFALKRRHIYPSYSWPYWWLLLKGQQSKVNYLLGILTVGQTKYCLF